MPGTFAESPESPGMLYQCNRKKGWNATDIEVEGWDNSLPEGTAWYAKNDPCPIGWRIPTQKELQSLVDTNSEWINQNDIYGRIFGTAPSQVFLPAVGFRSNRSGVLHHAGVLGTYWNNTQFTYATAWYLMIGSYGSGVSNNWQANGYSIRCVAK